MIENNYQASCDRCMDEGRDFEYRHSSQELGEGCTKAEFKRWLRSTGWVLSRPMQDERDLCPDCAAEVRAQKSKPNVA